MPTWAKVMPFSRKAASYVCAVSSGTPAATKKLYQSDGPDKEDADVEADTAVGAAHSVNYMSWSMSKASAAYPQQRQEP